MERGEVQAVALAEVVVLQGVEEEPEEELAGALEGVEEQQEVVGVEVRVREAAVAARRAHQVDRAGVTGPTLPPGI